MLENPVCLLILFIVEKEKGTSGGVTVSKLD